MLGLNVSFKIFLECGAIVTLITRNFLVVVNSIHVNIESTLLRSLVVTKLARELEALMNGLNMDPQTVFSRGLIVAVRTGKLLSSVYRGHMLLQHIFVSENLPTLLTWNWILTPSSLRSIESNCEHLLFLFFCFVRFFWVEDTVNCYIDLFNRIQSISRGFLRNLFLRTGFNQLVMHNSILTIEKFFKGTSAPFRFG